MTGTGSAQPPGTEPSPLPDLLRATWALLVRRWRVVMGLAVIVEIPAIVLQVPILALQARFVDFALADFGSMFGGELPSGATGREAILASLTHPAWIAWSLVAGAARLAAIVILVAALAAILAMEADGEEPTIGRVARRVTVRWRPLGAVIGVLAVALVLLGGLPAVAWLGLALAGGSPVPVIAASVLVVPVGLVVGGLLLYLAVRWAVAVPAIVAEGLGTAAALDRSEALVRGRLIHVSLAIVVGIVSVAVVGVIVGIPAGAFAFVGLVIRSAALVFVGGAISAVGQALTAPVVPAIIAMLHRDLADRDRSAGQRLPV